MVNAIIQSFSRSLLLNDIMVDEHPSEFDKLGCREPHLKPSSCGLNKLKIQEHNPLNVNGDAKELKSFIFYVEQYLKVTGTCS